MAKIKVPLEADYESIAIAAGAAPGTTQYWNDGTIIVPDVEQEALDLALENYDHQAVLLKREADALEMENKLTVEQEIGRLKERITALETKREVK